MARAIQQGLVHWNCITPDGSSLTDYPQPDGWLTPPPTTNELLISTKVVIGGIMSELRECNTCKHIDDDSICESCYSGIYSRWEIRK